MCNKLNILCNDTTFFRWWSYLVSQPEFKRLEVAVKASTVSTSCSLCKISWRVYVLVVRSPCSLLGDASDTKARRARALLIVTRILVTIWRSLRFLMWGRTLERVSVHCSSYITGCKDTTLVCALLLRSQKSWKKESNVGHFENEPNITENRMLVSTRTPDDITIQYLKCIRRVAIKATVSFVMSACQFARPRETTRLPVGKYCDVLYWEILSHFCRENPNSVNIGLKYQALYVRYFIVTRRNAVR